jgi:lauroyl/myristoyl acyltransferase
MLPVFAIRTGRRRCRVVFGPPVAVPRSNDRNADLTFAMSRIAAEVERAVRAAPHQWFVFRELWPKRPASLAEVRPDRAREREAAFNGDVDRVRR